MCVLRDENVTPTSYPAEGKSYISHVGKDFLYMYIIQKGLTSKSWDVHLGKFYELPMNIRLTCQHQNLDFFFLWKVWVYKGEK